MARIHETSVGRGDAHGPPHAAVRRDILREQRAYHEQHRGPGDRQGAVDVPLPGPRGGFPGARARGATSPPPPGGSTGGGGPPRRGKPPRAGPGFPPACPPPPPKWCAPPTLSPPTAPPISTAPISVMSGRCDPPV